MRRYALLVVFVVLACAKRSVEAPASVASMEADTAAVSMPATRVAAPAPAEAKAAATLPAIRMIIRTATLAVVVRDAADALKKVTAAAESRGGYVAETKQWREQDQVRASAVIRVPADHLNAILAEVRSIAVRVDSESVTGQDVSEEYSDLTAQLVNLEATEKELRGLLATVRQRMQKAADIIEVYNEITEVRGNIERIKGRMKYLEQMTAMSTINLELIPDVLTKPVVEPGWRPLAVVKNASRALVASLKWLVEAVIWIVIYVVPIVALFVGFVLLLRYLWRKLRRAETPQG